MPLVVIKSPPADLARSLDQLVQSRCPYPGCGVRPGPLVMLRNSRRDTPNYDNSLLLCSRHAQQAADRVIDIEMLRTIRQLLRPARIGSKGRSANTLASRGEYLAAVCDALAEPTSFLRVMYVGPLPFHPEWYFALHEAKTQMRNMDRAVRSRLEDDECQVRIICRNHDRYLEKVRDTLPMQLLEPFLEETRANLVRLCSAGGTNELVVADTGAFNIPVITDNIGISALRVEPRNPVEAGIAVYDADHVAWEKQAFDTMWNHYGSLQVDPVGESCSFLDRVGP